MGWNVMSDSYGPDAMAKACLGKIMLQLASPRKEQVAFRKGQSKTTDITYVDQVDKSITKANNSNTESSQICVCESGGE